MDHSQAKRLSEMEMNLGSDPVLDREWLMKPSQLSATEKKKKDWSSCIPAQETSHGASSSASINMISFGKSDATTHLHQQNSPNYDVKSINFSSPLVLESSNIEEIHGVFGYVKLSKRSSRRTRLQSEDHVLAERKRRRKLSRQILDLSTVVPGLEKLDKFSIIEGAFNYIKEFQEEKKRILEEYSAVSLKKSRLSSLDDTSSSEENLDSSPESSPNIDIKIAGDNVLFVIRCKELKGIIDEISGEVEKHHLRVITNCSMESGNGELLIIILAKMDVGFSLTTEDLASNIRMTLLNLM